MFHLRLKDGKNRIRFAIVPRFSAEQIAAFTEGEDVSAVPDSPVAPARSWTAFLKKLGKMPDSDLSSRGMKFAYGLNKDLARNDYRQAFGYSAEEAEASTEEELPSLETIYLASKRSKAEKRSAAVAEFEAESGEDEEEAVQSGGVVAKTVKDAEISDDSEAESNDDERDASYEPDQSTPSKKARVRTVKPSESFVEYAETQGDDPNKTEAENFEAHCKTVVNSKGEEVKVFVSNLRCRRVAAINEEARKRYPNANITCAFDISKQFVTCFQCAESHGAVKKGDGNDPDLSGGCTAKKDLTGVRAKIRSGLIATGVLSGASDPDRWVKLCEGVTPGRIDDAVRFTEVAGTAKRKKRGAAKGSPSKASKKAKKSNEAEPTVDAPAQDSPST